jgi:aspartyl-tRNA(Asn)/glutamyl-tRNA(Gln) amidotransferase subunit A
VKRALYSPVTLERILRDSTVTAPVYIESRRQMLLARRQAASAFADIDILVTPTTMFPPVRIDAALAAAPDEFSMIRNTLPFNALGLPTISVPCGLTRARLPIGLQLTAPWLGEARLLALAHAYELTIQFDRFEPPLA